MADTIAHFARKSLFSKLDCSRAYHYVQMADPLSVQLLVFIFASRTMAYQRLARGLKRTVTKLRAFIRNYLKLSLSSIIYTKVIFDFGCGVQATEQLLQYLKQAFQFLRRSQLKLSPE